MTVPSRTIASSFGFGRVEPPRRVQALLLARGKTRLPRSVNYATGLTERDQPATLTYWSARLAELRYL